MVTSSIAASAGRNLLLKVADPAVSPSSFVSVAGIRNLQVTINNNPVDITNHDSGGFREMLPDGGIQSYEFTMDGVMNLNNTGFSLLEHAARLRTLIEIQIVSGLGDSYLLAGVVSTLQRSGPLTDAETFNMTVMSHGSITYVAAP